MLQRRSPCKPLSVLSCSGTCDVTGAAEQRGAGVIATIREGHRRCRSQAIDVVEQVQSIGQVDPEIAVGIGSLHALWNRSLVEQIGETEDGIGYVDVAVAIAIAAQIISIEDAEAIQCR